LALFCRRSRRANTGLEDIELCTISLQLFVVTDSRTIASIKVEKGGTFKDQSTLAIGAFRDKGRL